MLNARTQNNTGSAAGTHRFNLASTYVDTAPSTASVTYSLRVIVTAATNITSAATGASITMNTITF